VSALRWLLLVALLAAFGAHAGSSDADTQHPLGIHDFAAISLVYGGTELEEQTSDGSPGRERKTALYGLRVNLGAYTHRTISGVLAGIEASFAFGYAPGYQVPLWGAAEVFGHIALVNVRGGVFGYRLHLVPAIVWNAYNGVAAGFGLRNTISIVPALTLDFALLGFGSIQATGSVRLTAHLVIEPIHTSIGFEVNAGLPERRLEADAFLLSLALRLPFEH
jgi:hypothetical protein